MKKIGIFLDEIKDHSISVEEKFQKLAHNTGNMLFWHSLKATLDLDVKSNWYINNPDKLNLSEYKAFVTTDLIWIRQNVSYSYLNKVLDILGDLPLVPISIGLQSNDYNPDFILHPETVDVIKRISERCVMGVRGYYTAEILKKYGIENFKVIGCPSMYMPGVDFAKISNVPKEIKKVTANFETAYGKFDSHKSDFLKYCAANNFSFVEQVQSGINEGNFSDSEDFAEVKGWIDAQGHCFFDVEQWREYMRGFDFSMGLRFHGNVMALWEGVPALFITCDSRTKELCEFYSLPNINITEFDVAKPIHYYYNLADYFNFTKRYKYCYNSFFDFIKENDLYSPANCTLEKQPVDNSKTKVVFYCKTIRQVLCALLLAVKERSEKQVIFFVNNFIYQELPNLTNAVYKGQSIVDKIVLYTTKSISSPNVSDSVLYAKEVEKYFDELLKSNSITLSNNDNINLFSSLRFSLYLILKNINFNLYEDSSGSFSKFNNMVLWNMYNEVDNFALSKQYGISDGSSRLIKKCYVDMSTQKDTKRQWIINNNKFENFSLVEYINTFTADELKEIYSVFDSDSKQFDSEYDYLIMTQYYGLKNIPLPQNMYFGLICDAFTKKGSKCAVKPHPADILNYSDLFTTIFNRNVPFELIAKFYKFKNIITISSTVNETGNNKIELGANFVDFPVLENFSAMLVVEKLMLDIKSIKYQGVNLNNFSQMVRTRFDRFCVTDSNDYELLFCKSVDDFCKSQNSGLDRFALCISDYISDECMFNDDTMVFDITADFKGKSVKHFYLYVKADRTKNCLSCFKEFLPYSHIELHIKGFSKMLYLSNKISTLSKQLEKAIQLFNRFDSLQIISEK